MVTTNASPSARTPPSSLEVARRVQPASSRKPALAVTVRLSPVLTEVTLSFTLTSSQGRPSSARARGHATSKKSPESVRSAVRILTTRGTNSKADASYVAKRLKPRPRPSHNTCLGRPIGSEGPSVCISRLSPRPRKDSGTSVTEIKFIRRSSNGENPPPTRPAVTERWVVGGGGEALRRSPELASDASHSSLWVTAGRNRR